MRRISNPTSTGDADAGRDVVSVVVMSSSLLTCEEPVDAFVMHYRLRLAP
jgi:hypothetical protein